MPAMARSPLRFLSSTCMVKGFSFHPRRAECSFRPQKKMECIFSIMFSGELLRTKNQFSPWAPATPTRDWKVVIDRPCSPSVSLAPDGRTARRAMYSPFSTPSIHPTILHAAFIDVSDAWGVKLQDARTERKSTCKEKSGFDLTVHALPIYLQVALTMR